MSIKDQITVDQWKLLMNAPSAASTFVSTASGSGFEIFNEVMSSSKFSAQLAVKEGGSGYGAVVDDVLAAMTSMTLEEAKETSVRFQATDLASARAEMLKYVGEAATFADTLPDGAGYKRWLLDMVREVAETKTGGILGFGGTSVIDDKEKAAISELAAILGIIES